MYANTKMEGALDAILLLFYAYQFASLHAGHALFFQTVLQNITVN